MRNRLIAAKVSETQADNTISLLAVHTIKQGRDMRYLVIIMVIASVFSLRPAHAGLDTCSFTLLNCLPDAIGWCSYDSDSFWDTLYASIHGDDLGSESSTDDGYCDSSSGCYVIAEETSSDWYVCTDYQVDGTADCNDYACIDTDSSGSITWNSGSSEYCCIGTANNACDTVCD